MIEGGCLCGAVRYRISGSPFSSANCHCESCRRSSGAPAVAWISIQRSELEILSGTPTIFHSSPHVTRQFCGICGTALTYETTDSSSTIDITSASLDDPNAFPPTAEVWLEDKLTWAASNARLDQFAKSSSS
jgi:hypothetical protein